MANVEPYQIAESLRVVGRRYPHTQSIPGCRHLRPPGRVPTGGQMHDPSVHLLGQMQSPPPAFQLVGRCSLFAISLGSDKLGPRPSPDVTALRAAKVDGGGVQLMEAISRIGEVRTPFG